MTNITISDHKHLIETGRYYKIPRDLRLCEDCNILDDESHFFLNCKINTTLRQNWYKHFSDINSNFTDLNNTEKLLKILNPSTPEDLGTIVSFIERSLEFRKGDPS